METVNIHEAKTQLSRLVDQAVKGEPFVIAKAGKPLVKVTALGARAARQRLGFLAAEIGVPGPAGQRLRRAPDHQPARREHRQLARAAQRSLRSPVAGPGPHRGRHTAHRRRAARSVSRPSAHGVNESQRVEWKTSWRDDY